MKQIRAIRILMGILFFAACTACLVIGPQVHPMARGARSLQISLAASSVAMGVFGVWLVVTFLFGRLYCASVCPVGVFSDLFFGIRRRVRRLDRPFSYRPGSRWSLRVLAVFAICLFAGVSAVVFSLAPFDIARNMASVANPRAVGSTWATISLGTGTGVVVGILSIIGLAATSIWRGREFCSRWCPVGTAFGYVQEHARMHIEFDPDRCTSCGLCEERCRTQSIKVVSRYVDQRRCVRCFDCVADCPEGAIRYQLKRNRPATPLFRKAGAK